MTIAQREQLRVYEANYRKRHPEKYREKSRNYQRRKWKERPEEAKAYQRAYRRKIRENLIKEYGGICRCCGETDIRFLTFDHINGGGTKERKLLKRNGSHYYLVLRKTKREDIQILCYNCNCSKGIYGKCPHKN